ncbi:MAG: hypothetical protein ACYC3A_05105 [Halothiobacillus sp.]
MSIMVLFLRARLAMSTWGAVDDAHGQAVELMLFEKKHPQRAEGVGLI